jgi:uncharacterized protein (DUF433 family)
MSQAAIEYVESVPGGGWRISGSRVSLDSIVHAYWEGKSPEAIVEEFPTLSAERVYGAIAFYLNRRQEVDDFLTQQERKFEELREANQTEHGPLLDRIRASRQKGSSS